MTERPVRLRRLSARQLGLLVEALFGLIVASLVVAMLPFRTICKLVVRPDETKAPDEPDALFSIAWAVQACARRVPFRAKCFEQGLAAWWMLHRRGIDATLHYGAALRGESLVAHVWVTAEHHNIVGWQNADRFQELVRLPLR